MAAKDAKDAVHREMEALAAAERLKEVWIYWKYLRRL